MRLWRLKIDFDFGYGFLSIKMGLFVRLESLEV
jgi:hypothetical protein